MEVFGGFWKAARGVCEVGVEKGGRVCRRWRRGDTDWLKP